MRPVTALYDRVTGETMPVPVTSDPIRDEIWSAVTPFLEDIKVYGAQVLVAIYIRPEKTKGGVILSTKTLDEDVYQGKVGMVLKCGPLAFEEDDTHRWPDKPKPGDWVVYRIGDTFPFVLGERSKIEQGGARHCRFIEDVNIRGVVDRPDIVY